MGNGWGTLRGLARAVGCVAWVASGCSPDTSDSDTSTSTPGACGERSTIASVEITGFVQSTVDQSRVPDVQIQLVETNWAPGTIHGTGRSDANGRFTMTASNITVIEDCWGLAVSYWLEGQKQDGWSGDKPMNPELMQVWETGDTDVVLEFPLLMYPPE